MDLSRFFQAQCNVWDGTQLKEIRLKCTVKALSQSMQSLTKIDWVFSDAMCSSLKTSWWLFYWCWERTQPTRWLICLESTARLTYPLPQRDSSNKEEDGLMVDSVPVCMHVVCFARNVEDPKWLRKNAVFHSYCSSRFSTTFSRSLCSALWLVILLRSYTLYLDLRIYF